MDNKGLKIGFFLSLIGGFISLIIGFMGVFVRVFLINPFLLGICILFGVLIRQKSVKASGYIIIIGSIVFTLTYPLMLIINGFSYVLSLLGGIIILLANSGAFLKFKKERNKLNDRLMLLFIILLIVGIASPFVIYLYSFSTPSQELIIIWYTIGIGGISGAIIITESFSRKYGFEKEKKIKKIEKARTKSQFLRFNIIYASILTVSIILISAPLFHYNTFSPVMSYGAKAANIDVAISSDGTYIATEDGHHKIMLCEKTQSTPLWTYDTGNHIGSIDISSDGNFIVCSTGRRMFLFHKSNSSPQWIYEGTESIYSVSISSNGSDIAASGVNSIYLFNLSSSVPVWTCNESASGLGIQSVMISADGNYIVAGSDSTINSRCYLLNRSSSIPMLNYTKSGRIKSVSISSNGNYFAASGANSISLFEKTSSTPIQTWLSDSFVQSVSISADGKYIAAATNDGKVLLCEKSSSVPIWAYTSEGLMDSVSISSDGNYIAAGNSYNAFFLFEKSSSTPLWMYKEYGDTTAIISEIVSVDISSDGNYIVTGTKNSVTNLFIRDNFYISDSMIRLILIMCLLGVALAVYFIIYFTSFRKGKRKTE